MATTKIADIEFDPDVYAAMMQEDDPSKNAFVQSGVITTNELLTARADGASDTTSIPYWDDLDNSDENISSDDPAALATPDKITSGKMRARRIHVNNAWQTADLAAEVSAENPMEQIRSRTSNYWLNRISARVQGIQTGLYLENAANEDDMIVDVAIEDGDNALVANLWSFDTFVDGYSTMGENAEKLALLCVHPEVMKTIRKENNIELIRDSDTDVMISMYGEKVRVIEDKKQPVIAGTTSGFKYVSTLYAAGSFGMGEALAETPVEVDRSALGGNGGGIETLVERKQIILHPAGYDWTETAVVGESPTVAECSDPDNWDRKFLRENVALAWIVTNG